MSIAVWYCRLAPVRSWVCVPKKLRLSYILKWGPCYITNFLSHGITYLNIVCCYAVKVIKAIKAIKSQDCTFQLFTWYKKCKKPIFFTFTFLSKYRTMENIKNSLVWPFLYFNMTLCPKSLKCRGVKRMARQIYSKNKWNLIFKNYYLFRVIKAIIWWSYWRRKSVI